MKDALRYVLAVFLFIIALWILTRDQYLELLKDLSFADIVISLILCLFVFTASGLKIWFVLLKQYHLRISLIDVVALPILMSLWSYILPFKGGLLYGILFLKSKYQVKAARGISISVYTYLISLVVVGLLGFYYCLKYNSLPSVMIMSLLFVMSPFLIRIFHNLFKKLAFSPSSFLGKIQHWTNTIMEEVRISWDNTPTTLISSLISLTHLSLRSLWYYWTAIIFHIDISVLAIVAMALLTELALIIRITPGNLGVNELLSGGLLTLLGETMAEGILISVFIRFSTFVIMFTIGAGALLANLSHFEMKNLRSLFQTLKHQVTEKQAT